MLQILSITYEFSSVETLKVHRYKLLMNVSEIFKRFYSKIVCSLQHAFISYRYHMHAFQRLDSDAQTAEGFQCRFQLRVSMKSILIGFLHTRNERTFWKVSAIIFHFYFNLLYLYIWMKTDVWMWENVWIVWKTWEKCW